MDNISHDASITAIENSELQVNDMWWSVNLTTKEYLCSDHWLSVCGLERAHFTKDDFLMMIHPDHKNKVMMSLYSFDDTQSFDEKFQVLTKYGYRWVRSTLDGITPNDKGESVIHGHITFLEDNEVYVAQDLKAKVRLNEIIMRYTSVSESLMELLNVPDVSTVILKTLHDILDEFSGDRVYIFEYDTKNMTQSCVYEVVSGSVSTEKTDLQNFPMSGTKWWTEMLFYQNMPIVLDDLNGLPSYALDEYKMLSKQNIQSIMVVPLVTRNSVGGFLGVDMVEMPHKWTKTDIQWFQSLANVINLCIELKKSEELAHRERAHYSSLYENMPIGFIRLKLLYDNDNHPVDYMLLEVNSVAKQLVCAPGQNVVGKLASEVSDNIPDNILKKFDEIIKTRGLVKGKVNLQQDRYFDYTIYSVEDDEVIVLMQDNTDSILTMRALEKSEKTLQNIYKNIPVGIEIYDKNGVLISINDVEREIFGFGSVEKILGLNLFENPNVPKPFLEDMKNHVPSSCDFYYNFANLNNYYSTPLKIKKHLVLKGVMLYDADNNVENYLLIVIDNTDSLKAGHRIKEFETLFNSIAEFAEVGMCQWNPCEKSIVATDQWYCNLGQQKREISDIREAYSNLHEEDYIKMQRCFEKIISGEISSFREEVRVKNGDGLRWLRSSYKVSEYVPEQNIIDIIGINIDITELKNTEIKLTQAKIKAEESDRLKSAFLANMSHEIRTPLNAIVGFSDLLVDSRELSERQEYISIIKQNNDLLLQLISDILDISKMESGIVDVLLESVNINGLCEDVVSAQSMKASKDVHVEFVTQCSKCIVLSDRNHLVQILSNLVGNAIKFTKKGAITVGYFIEENDVKFYVKDTGVGIKAEQLKTIFNRFIKLNAFIPGTGLGLPICSTLVDKMGGKIWAESEYGSGSTFFFTIPYQTQGVGALDENIENSITQCSNYSYIKQKAKPLILVAEDNDSSYLLIVNILKENFTIIRAYDGVQAINLFKNRKPNLILMDMKMPKMDGIEATRKIHEIDAEVPIIMLTAFAYDNDKFLSLEAGCCDFMTKPLHTVKLKELIDKYLPAKK